MPNDTAASPLDARPRLFVSHSSGEGPAREQLKQICLAIEQAGGMRTLADSESVEVIVDHANIQPGQEWPRNIHEWLAEADAAVILFSPRTLKSKWVMKEAAILSWRKALDPSFKLLPVRMPGVDEAEFTTGVFSALGLSNVQFVNHDDPAAIANAVGAAIGPLRRMRTPFDR